VKLFFDGLAIAAGGAAGAVCRWMVGLACGRLFGTRFPVGTMVINLTGSFFLGWFATLAAGRLTVSDTARLAIAVGFVGAYTTFSTFMFESIALWDNGALFKAMLNLVASIVLGLSAVRLGMALAGR